MGPADYTYDGEGNITSIATATNTDSYVYDNMGRLLSATVGGKTESYKYDSFGNRTERALTGSAPAVLSIDEASNRLNGQEYDEAGNLVTRKERQRYVYDGLNMITFTPTADGMSGRRILYDANDERIASMYLGKTRWTIRDFAGQILREFESSGWIFDNPWRWEQDHVRGEGQLIGGESVRWSLNSQNMSWGGRRHYHLDHLGSVRLVSDDNRKSLAQHDYFPFGATRTAIWQEPVNPGDQQVDGMRFAGHWRDFLGEFIVESPDYIDSMHARYYDPQMGRFLSVDPNNFWQVRAGDAIGQEKLRNQLRKPQGWNRYSYVSNDPINAIDPDGRETYVITTFDYGVGSHSAVLVARNGDNVLYDPAGSYVPESVKAEGGQRGSGDMFYGKDADLKSYVAYQKSTGSEVKVLKFNTTPQQETQIKNRIEQRPGNTAPGRCAQAVCSVITGIGPFKDVKPTSWPGRLYERLKDLFTK